MSILMPYGFKQLCICIRFTA